MTAQPAPSSRLDHLVVGALSLQEGVRWFEERFGLRPQPGGVHPRMATHNALLKIGEEIYLEIIAPDPHAAAPSRPRWFDLDDSEMRAKLAIRPRLIAWAARTDDLALAVASSPVPLGEIEPMTRGDLAWKVAIPADGSLPEAGAMPLLIEWGAGMAHPSARLSNAGCRLERLEIGHASPESLSAAFAAIGLETGSQISILPGLAGLRATLSAEGRSFTLE